MTKTRIRKNEKNDAFDTQQLREQLRSMHMTWVEQHFETMGEKAAENQSTHIGYLAQLIDGESKSREERAISRRVAAARLPVLKTLEQFEWSWPASINQMQVRHLFRLGFLEQKGNIIFIGSTEHAT